jgi:ABC-type phosphate/phosphonate transport system substrate-binding protein
MIASLPMYDWPEVREASDGWWNGLSRHLGLELPLERGFDHFPSWRRDDLVFSQACGYPFTHEFRGLLAYVSTPHYMADGCGAANYRSMILARNATPLPHLQGAVAAVNTPDSMSGMLALQLVFAPFAEAGRFFKRAIETGSHVGSMIAVRDGKADVCAIDAVCIAMAKRYRPDYLEGLVEIGRSPLVPSLPFVTRLGDVDKLRDGLAAAFADTELADVRERLFLAGNSVLGAQAYERIIDLETEMLKVGGLKLL